MDSQDFKEQQHDRIEEGKDLKREDELKDLSQIPSKQLPGPAGKSIFSKISEGISNVATAISEKVGLSEPVIEGHEDLDKDVRKQVKKINKEILKRAAEKGPEVEKVNEWEHTLPKQLKKEIEDLKSEGKDTMSKASSKVDEAKDSTSSKIKESTSSESSKPSGPSFTGKVSDRISQGVDALKDKFTTRKEEERSEDGTKTFTTVKDGFNETVDELKHEKRVEELGQEELTSRNPFQALTSGTNDTEESEGKTMTEKVKGGLSDASQKISSTIGGVSQKVKSTFSHKENTVEDKENSRQTA